MLFGLLTKPIRAEANPDILFSDLFCALIMCVFNLLFKNSKVNFLEIKSSLKTNTDLFTKIKK